MLETDGVTLVVRAPGSHGIVPSLADAISDTKAVFRRLAQVVVENGFDVPAFICLRRGTTETHLFLIGEVTARITGSGETILDGTGTSTWTEHTAPITADVSIRWSAVEAPTPELSVAELDESPEFPEADPEPDPVDQTPAAPVSPVTEMPEPTAITTVPEARQETPAQVSPVQPPEEPEPPTPPAPPAPTAPRTMPDPNLLGTDQVDIVAAETPEPIEAPPPVVLKTAAAPPQAPDRAEAPDPDLTLDADEIRRSLPEKPPPAPPVNSPLVTARVCPCSAPSPLSAEFCTTCGSSMRREGVTIEQVPRPLLGYLVLDDGVRLPLEDSFVLGRNVPEVVEIADRQYPGISIDSPSKQVSKTHLEVRLVDWTVNVVDLDSANGTYIDDAEGHSPKRLRPNVVEQLAPGDNVHFGDRSFAFEAIAG